MQLKDGSIASAIGLLAAGLLGPAPARAQDATSIDSGVAAPARAPNAYDATASEPGTLVADTAVLFYQEDAGRVRAIEAESGLVWNKANGTVLSAKITYDSLTGATPNGAIRSHSVERFEPPAQPRAGDDEHLPALGVIDGGTGASGTYTIPAGQLPVDKNFKDNREALDLGATLPVTDSLKVSVGGAISHEGDFDSRSARATLIKELFAKNTTLSVGFNYEHDKVKPFGGIPLALGDMGSEAFAKSRVKQVYNIVAGVTQVLTPEWLVQVNYSYGHSTGYHTDPYKLVSLVDRTSGDPFFAIYESRPGQRDRHSVYLGSKLATGSFVTDASARWYSDSWGIKALTFAVSEHIPVGRSAYIEPGVRWYHQTQARFFRNFLYLDEATPDHVSADSRLGRFGAWTLGLKGGAKVASNLEVYASAERYWQYGQHYDTSLPGNLASTDLFSGTKSYSLVAGLRLTFR
ncbi:MAG: hypothetical protein RIS94_2330 [Pseudomonadota bacterium]|jgi:hypothetical protein